MGYEATDCRSAQKFPMQRGKEGEEGKTERVISLMGENK